MRTQIPGKQILDQTVDTVDIANNAVTDQKLSDSGVTAGSYTKVTVNQKGRVTLGANPTTLAGYGITDAISKNDGNSVITVNTETDRPGSRRLTVSPELQITDGGALSTFNIGIAQNVVLPGTGAITLVSGTTAQRPNTALPGMLRFNTTKNTIEYPIGPDWTSLIADTDKRLQVKNTLIVQKDPGPGQFSSVKAAIASITDAAADNRYAVHVAAGSFAEDPIVMKRYVSIVGENASATIIKANDPNSDLISAVNDSALEHVTLSGATGTGVSALIFNNAVENETFRSFTASDIRFGANNRHITVKSAGNYTAAYLTAMQFGGSMPYDEAIHVESSGGGVARLFLRNSTTRGAVAPLPSKFAYVSGIGAELVTVASLFRTSISTPTGVGYHIRDGGLLRVIGGTLRGFATGVWAENAGIAPTVNLYSLGLESNTTDINIEHPGTKGAFQGIATKSKVWSSSNNISIMYMDPAVQGVSLVGKFNLGPTQALLTDVTDLIIETPPVGLLSGGVVTAAGALNLTVAAGAGYLRKDGNMTRVEWQQAPITIAPGNSPYIYVDKNAVVQQSIALPDPEANIILARAQTSGTAITGLGSMAVQIKSHGNALEDYLRYAVGPVYVSGSIVTANATTPRAIDVSAGQAYYGTIKRSPSAKVAPYFVDVHRTGGVTVTSDVRNIVPNDTIDDGTNLVAVPAGAYTKHGLYSSSEGVFQAYFLSHAQTYYTTLEDAIKAPLPAPRIVPDAVPVIAGIIMQQGVDAIVQILDVRPMFMRASNGATGAANDHGELLGLGDDDHLQYLRTDGTRALTGDLNLGTREIKNAGAINGINILSHASRHAPQGADPIPTASAVDLNASSTSTAGVSNFLARADHTHRITGFQPVSTELTSFAALNTFGIPIHTAANTWAIRSLAGAGGRISITNGNGVAGNPTIDLTTVGTAGTYAQVTTDAFGRVTGGTNTMPWSFLSNTPTTLAGYGITDAQSASTILNSLAQLAGSGIFTITGSGTAAARTLIAPTNGFTIANANGVGGDPTFTLSNDLAGVEGLSTVGLAARAGADTWITRVLVPPAAGLTIANASAASGDPTFALANDLAALEGLSTFGLSVRTAADAWATRTIAGTAGNVNVTNGSGVAGNPTIDLATTGTAGTYKSVTTDAFGRVTSGSNPTTLAGYGITDAVSTSLVGANNGLATLDSTGKLSSAQIPALAISDTFVVASQAAQLALIAEVGDVAVRTDLNKSFILRVAGPSTFANWQELLTPTDSVLSVNGQTGAVVINTGVMSIGAAAPAQGFTITGSPVTSTGTFTFALANDLAAVEGLGTTGFAVRTAADTWATRALTAGSGITISNGDGIAGAPSIALSSVGTAGSYFQVTTDAQGRVTAGTNPTTLAGFGITDAVPKSNTTAAATGNTVVLRDASGNFNAGTITANLTGNATTATSATKLTTPRLIGTQSFDGTANVTLTPVDVNLGNVTNALQVINAGNAPRMSTGNLASRPAAGALGAMYLANDTGLWYRDNGTGWDPMLEAFTGDVTSPVGSNVLTLNNTAVAGTYDRITINAKGLVTAGTITTDRMNQMFSGSIASQTGTSTIILTATGVPTSTQGTAIATQVITPASTQSRIVIDFCGLVDTNFNGGVFIAVFRGTTFLGCAVTATQEASGNTTISTPETFSLKIVDTPGVLTAQTYTIRIGGNAAGTWWLGRTEGLSIGGLNKSYWTMTEII